MSWVWSECDFRCLIFERRRLLSLNRDADTRQKTWRRTKERRGPRQTWADVRVTGCVSVSSGQSRQHTEDCRTHAVPFSATLSTVCTSTGTAMENEQFKSRSSSPLWNSTCYKTEHFPTPFISSCLYHLSSCGGRVLYLIWFGCNVFHESCK